MLADLAVTKHYIPDTFPLNYTYFPDTKLADSYTLLHPKIDKKMPLPNHHPYA
jgi:hypothetical protein